jgi:HEAT repeats
MRNWKSFTTGRSLGWLTIGLVAVLAFAFAAPEWYWAWVGARKREHYYQGRPTSYWSAVLRNPSPGWAAFIATSLRGFLGLGGYPAILRRDPAAVPVLLDLLKDGDWQVRWDALLSLTETPVLPAEVPQAILPLLTQEHAELRSFAANRLTTLGAMGPAAKEAVPALLAAYQRGTAPFLDRQAVIAALRCIDPEAAEAAVRGHFPGPERGPLLLGYREG